MFQKVGPDPMIPVAISGRIRRKNPRMGAEMMDATVAAENVPWQMKKRDGLVSTTNSKKKERNNHLLEKHLVSLEM